jgi:hypothetical protein
MKIKPSDITVEFVQKTGGTMTGSLSIQVPTVSNLSLTREDNLASLFELFQYNTGTSSANFRGNKARGTIASPSGVITNDQISGFLGRAYHSGGAFSGNIAFAGFAALQDITSTAQGTYFTLELTPIGSTSRSRIAKIDWTDGFTFANGVVIDVNRHFQLRSYVRTSLPSATPEGQMIYVSNATGGATQAFSNGVNWISVITGAAV